jgi:hypothetical protein
VDFANYIKIAKTSKRRPTIRRLRFLKLKVGQINTRCFFWLLISILSLSTGLAAASGAEVTDLVINNSQGHLLLSAKIRNVITEEVNASLTDEICASIVFSIALYQVSQFWFDKKIAHQTATNTIKYDPLKKEYNLLRSWESGPPLVVGALNEARQVMTEVNDLKVMPLARLEKGCNYQIRVQAVCQDQNAFIFSPSECVNTDWHTVDFTF